MVWFLTLVVFMLLHVRVYFHLYTRNSCTFTMIHKPLCIWYGFDNVAICLLQVIRYSQSAAFYFPTISVVYWKRIVKQYPEYEQKSQRRRHASSISNCGYILKRSVQWNMRTTFYSTFVRSVHMSFCCKCSGIHINICIHTCTMLYASLQLPGHLCMCVLYLAVYTLYLSTWIHGYAFCTVHNATFCHSVCLRFLLNCISPLTCRYMGTAQCIYNIQHIFTNTQSRTHTLPVSASAYTPMQSTIIFGVISLVVRFNLYLILVIYVLHIRFRVYSLNQTQPHQVQSIFRLCLICTILYLV